MEPSSGSVRVQRFRSPDMDGRRELSRQYKETPPAMGVYVIRNTVDNRVFLNGSLSLPGAMNRDRFELGLKSHRSKSLLADWIRLGAGSFRFEVIDTLKRRDDPDFDYRRELVELLELWKEEFDRRGDRTYEVGR